MTSQIPPTLVKVAPPAGFNWPFSTYPLTVYRNGTTYGAQVSTDFVAEKYINPNCYLKTYHVATTGSDSNSGLGSYPGDFSQATLSITKAITLGNATAAPYSILINSGVYYRTYNFAYGSVYPTQDVAIWAYGGPVTCTTADNLTYTLTTGATYQSALANCYRVVDLLNKTAFGAWVDLTLASSLSNCESTAGTWYNDGTNVYVHRSDGAAVTSTNTRVYRNAFNGYFPNAGNVYLNGLNFEGSTNGALWRAPATAVTGNTIAVNCSFGYAGQLATGSGCHGVTMDNINGLAAFVNCVGLGNPDDAFNFHWDVTPSTAAGLYPLLINCVAKGNGSGNSTSVNGYTFHDGIIGIDVGGDYEYNFGGNVTCVLGVGTNRPTQCWCVGTKAAFSRGDYPLGGTTPPRDFSIDGILSSVPCAMWVDGGYAGSATSDSQAAQSLAATTSAVLYTRNVVNSSATTVGTITSY